MWDKITDPKTNKQYKITSNKGQQILEKYVQKMTGAGKEKCVDMLKNKKQCWDFSTHPNGGISGYMKGYCTNEWKKYNKTLESNCDTSKFNIECRDSRVGRGCLDKTSMLNKITAFGPDMVAKTWSGIKSFKGFIYSCAGFYNTLSEDEIDNLSNIAESIKAKKTNVQELGNALDSLGPKSQKALLEMTNMDSPGFKMILETDQKTGDLSGSIQHFDDAMKESKIDHVVTNIYEQSVTPAAKRRSTTRSPRRSYRSPRISPRRSSRSSSKKKSPSRRSPKRSRSRSQDGGGLGSWIKGKWDGSRKFRGIVYILFIVLFLLISAVGVCLFTGGSLCAPLLNFVSPATSYVGLTTAAEGSTTLAGHLTAAQTALTGHLTAAQTAVTSGTAYQTASEYVGQATDAVTETAGNVYNASTNYLGITSNANEIANAEKLVNAAKVSVTSSFPTSASASGANYADYAKAMADIGKAEQHVKNLKAIPTLGSHVGQATDFIMQDPTGYGKTAAAAALITFSPKSIGPILSLSISLLSALGYIAVPGLPIVMIVIQLSSAFATPLWKMIKNGFKNLKKKPVKPISPSKSSGKSPDKSPRKSSDKSPDKSPRKSSGKSSGKSPRKSKLPRRTRITRRSSRGPRDKSKINIVNKIVEKQQAEMKERLEKRMNEIENQ